MFLVGFVVVMVSKGNYFTCISQVLHDYEAICILNNRGKLIKWLTLTDNIVASKECTTNRLAYLIQEEMVTTLFLVSEYSDVNAQSQANILHSNK